MNVLVIFPQKNALNPIDGATTRSWTFVRSLINNNFNVTILHSAEAKGLEDKKLKQKCKIHYVRKLNIFPLREKFFDDFNPFFIIKLFKILRREKFDIIQIEAPFGFFLLKLFSKRNSVIIFDSLGVEGEFIKVSLYEKRFPRILYHTVRIYMKIYEKFVCKLADIIINISEFDRNYYIKNYKINKNKTILIQVPSSINPNEILIRTESLKRKYRKKLNLPLDKTIVMFHGHLPHPPNEEAVYIIKNYIAPKIKNQEIVFVLAGRNMKKFKKKNIISLDFIKNLKDLLYSADFAIVPIISGEGQRVKCSDYITTALPFICTKKGIQGIDFLKEGEDFLLYEKINNEFLEGIKILHENKELRKSIHENLSKKSHYLNQNTIEKKIIKLYSKINNRR